MVDHIDIVLLDNSNTILEETNIERPKTYEELKNIIKKNLKKLSENYCIYYLSSNNNQIEINNNEEYQLSKDILFIHNIDKEDLNKSTFEIYYNKIQGDKKEKLEEKYCCSICSSIIKKEKPLFCYICQKIFHKSCLKEWDKQKGDNRKLKCPICRNELPLNQWKEQLNYEENRKNEAEIMIKLNELKNKNDKKADMIKYYLIYLRKISKLLINILIKINKISSIIKPGLINEKLNNLIRHYSNTPLNSEIDDIYNVILEELDKIIKFNENIDLINKENKERKNEIINEDKKEIKFKLLKKEKQENINYFINNYNFTEPKILNTYCAKNTIKNHPSKLIINNNDEIIESKNVINLIYYSRNEGNKNIFGEKFVENNYNNIILIINDNESELKYNHLLKEGENNIKMIIKNYNTINLSHMFERCSSLINIDGLKYLNTKYASDFSYMFCGCIYLSDITPLKNWNVSNSTNFQHMFSGCTSLFDITPLKNWKVSKCKNFKYMFDGCELLGEINSLKEWDVQNGANFSFMFNGCLSLADLSGLDNWQVLNSLNFQYMFCHCKSIKNLTALKNWSVIKCKNFSSMFSYCSNLKDIDALKNWNVSKGVNLNSIFDKCYIISDFTPIKNWAGYNSKIYEENMSH